MELFYNPGKDLRDFLQDRMNSVINEIKAQTKNYILNVSIQDYTKYLVKKYELKTPTLREEEISTGCEEIEIDITRNSSQFFGFSSNSRYVTGTKITLYIPFEGDLDLFKYRPTHYYANSLKGTLNNQELRLFFEGANYPHEQVKAELERQIAKIKEYLGWVEADVKYFNDNLAQNITSQITSRRDKLLRDSDLVSSLGFPLKERSGMPKTYTVPIERKEIVSQPIASTESYVPEPTLDMENYEHILNVVNNMTQVIERSPQTFKSMIEEDIRQHFLVQLNGHYEGQATGETFNYEGKTDILIRVDGKNIFISECKFWKGASVLIDTIDQLLGYLSWRDTKTAIFLFNRNKDLSKVLAQIPETVKKHPNFKKEIKYNSETGFRYIFGHNNDSNKELYLTILVFDVPN